MPRKSLGFCRKRAETTQSLPPDPRNSHCCGALLRESLPSQTRLAISGDTELFEEGHAIKDATQNRAVSSDDAALMRRVAEGDQAAVAALYDRYAALVLTQARRILRNAQAAEELLEDIFVELWRRADRYDPTRGTPTTYIVTLTRSRAIDRLRADSRGHAASLAETPEPSCPAAPPERALVDQDRQTQMAKALSELSADQRQAIELSFYDDLSHADIAQRLGKPLGTVKTWIRQGLIRLRDCLLTDEGEVP
jgi:RNA polymerase sigma-70 factor (ECF subfamily)